MSTATPPANADLAKSLQEMLNGKAPSMNQSGGNNCGAKYGGNYKHQKGGNKHQSAGKRKSRVKKSRGRKSRGRKSRRRL